MNVLANWVGLQNKDRWQWITQMFHCGNSAICCASNMIVSKILPRSIPLQLTYHLLPYYGATQYEDECCGWPLFYHLCVQKRIVWKILFTQFSGWCVSISGQVPFALKSLEVGVTLKSPIWRNPWCPGSFLIFSKHEADQVNSYSELSRSPSVPGSSLTNWCQTETRLKGKCRTTACARLRYKGVQITTVMKKTFQDVHHSKGS